MWKTLKRSKVGCALFAKGSWFGAPDLISLIPDNGIRSCITAKVQGLERSIDMEREEGVVSL
jgi:hypothetical protein